MTDKKTTPARVRRREGASKVESMMHFGVAKLTIEKWEKKGWVVRFKDRSIDLRSTGIRVDAHKDPRRGGKPDRGTNATPSSYAAMGDAVETPDAADEAARNLDAPPEDAAQCDMNEASRRKVYWQAKKAEFEARKLDGELVEVEATRLVWAKTTAIIRSRLQLIAPGVASELIAAGQGEDIHVIESKIEDGVGEALMELSDEQPR